MSTRLAMISISVSIQLIEFSNLWIGFGLYVIKLNMNSYSSLVGAGVRLSALWDYGRDCRTTVVWARNWPRYSVRRNVWSNQERRKVKPDFLDETQQHDHDCQQQHNPSRLEQDHERDSGKHEQNDDSIIGLRIVIVAITTSRGGDGAQSGPCNSILVWKD